MPEIAKPCQILKVNLRDLLGCPLSSMPPLFSLPATHLLESRASSSKGGSVSDSIGAVGEGLTSLGGSGGDGEGLSIGAILVIVGLVLSVVAFILAIYNHSHKKQKNQAEREHEEVPAMTRYDAEVAAMKSPRPPYEIPSAYDNADFRLVPVHGGHSRGNSIASTPSFGSGSSSVGVKEPPRVVMSYFGAGDRRGSYQPVGDDRPAPVWPDR